MQQTRPAQYGLRWTDNTFGELDPAWTVSPDITIIKQLAIQHLPDDFKNSEISTFAEGAFNKLYEISSSSNTQKYLMRVSLPVEPFFKTESEVATIAYIRKHTSIPVPQIIAYDSSPENDLGFEWILMERIQGSCLYDVWENMPYDSKVDLTVHVADLLKQLDDFQFTQFGNLYFSNVKDRVDSKRNVAEDKTYEKNVNIDIGNKFVIGRIVSPWFFRDKRVWLPGDRGPFPSSHELMLTETDIQIERIKNLSPVPTDEYFSETDEELAEDQEAILETCNNLRKLVSVIFPSVNCSEKKVIYHSDLSCGNILVDPVTYRITGIVDWECVSIRPDWDVCDYPHFLKGIEVLEPLPVGTPGINEDGLLEIRKDWERVLLRRVYKDRVPNTVGDNRDVQAAMEATSNHWKDIVLKRRFARKLAEIEMRWKAARYWMKHLDLPGQHSTSN